MTGPLDLDRPWNLVHGDALRTLMSLPDACADAVVTDPPYSSGGFTRGDRMGSTTNKYVQTQTQIDRPDFAGDNRDQRGYLVWCSVWMEEALRVVKPGGSITDWRQLPVTTDAVQSGGWVWRGIVPWDKGEGTRPRRGGFRAQSEYVVWGTAGPLREDHEEYLPGFLHVLGDGAYGSGSLVVPVTQADKHHITGKPSALMRELVRIVPVGGLIVDPFAGSSTTGVACIETGRRFVGVEKTAEYYHVSLERLRNTAAAPTLFESPSMMEPAPPRLFEEPEPEPDELAEVEEP